MGGTSKELGTLGSLIKLLDTRALPTTGHVYFGNIDPAFPGNSLCNRILSDLNLKKNPDYTGIPRPSPTSYRKFHGKKFL